MTCDSQISASDLANSLPENLRPESTEGLTPLQAFIQAWCLKNQSGEAEEAGDLTGQHASFDESYSPSAILSLIATSCQQSLLGKKLPTAFYIHVSALDALPPILQLYESFARQILNSSQVYNIIKIHTHQPKISYLFYPLFETDAHPALQSSIQVNLEIGTVKSSDYSESDNPPILHRKETFVTPDFPQYEVFAQLTQREEALGLLESTHSIGTYQGWWDLLEAHGVEIQGHSIIEHYPRPEIGFVPKIERHKAAIFRTALSKPVRLAWASNLFFEGSTFFDYGCGYGGDIQRISEKGYIAEGWDPYYRPDVPREAADIVNIGYIINVIECQDERREALIQAWNLTKKVLIVAAQVLIADRHQGQIAYGDGVITSRNTFQKYYEQEELKFYIDQVLNVDSIPVALGIYFVFRDETEAQNFRVSRFHRSLSTPRVRLPVKRFEDYQEMLAPLMAFISDRGRLPVAGELAEEEVIKQEFKTFARAFQVILQATVPEEWEAIADQRRQDLLVYIALTHFDDNFRLMSLSKQVKEDIKGLFGTIKKAFTLADLMLYSLGNLDVIADSCQQSAIGCKKANSLSVHVSALAELDPLLRLYEGCANRTIGRLDGATIIKFSAKTPKISYWFYPNFDTDPYPALDTVMHIDLRDLSVSYQDYHESQNPPILHRKDAYVMPSYPLYQKFVYLSRQEEYLGLFEERPAPKTRKELMQCLREHCVTVKNHRLVWRPGADAERVSFLKARMRERMGKRKVEQLEAVAEGESLEPVASASDLSDTVPTSHSD